MQTPGQQRLLPLLVIDVFLSPRAESRVRKALNHGTEWVSDITQNPHTKLNISILIFTGPSCSTDITDSQIRLLTFLDLIKLRGRHWLGTPITLSPCETQVLGFSQMSQFLSNFMSICKVCVWYLHNWTELILKSHSISFTQLCSFVCSVLYPAISISYWFTTIIYTR